MTEEEAKTKWCPFARVHVPAGMINRVSRALKRIAAKMRAEGHDLRDAEFIEEQEADTRCLGSECMAWRAPNEASRTGGYCGLAGSP